MAINIITSFDSSSREILDKRSGPYASVSAALSALGTNSRPMGMPIYVIADGTQDAAGNYITGTVQTYSFREGIEDVNLVSIDVVDKHFAYDQGVPSSIWTINHGLGKYASIVVTDTAGSIVMGDVQYIDLNNITITFNASFSGSAYLN
jgi:hypothetical protein